MNYNDPDFKKYLQPVNELPLVERPYSITHVQKRFKEIYDLDVVKHDYGYKGYRYRRYIEYDVYNSDGDCILKHMTLKALAEHLIKKGEY